VGQVIDQAIRNRNNFTRRKRKRGNLLARVTDISMVYPKTTAACYESCEFSIKKSVYLVFRGSERVDPVLSRTLQLF